MKVWIVLEEDRGYGVSVAGIFTSLKLAQDFAESSGYRYYVENVEGKEIIGD